MQWNDTLKTEKKVTHAHPSALIIPVCSSGQVGHRFSKGNADHDITIIRNTILKQGHNKSYYDVVASYIRVTRLGRMNSGNRLKSLQGGKEKDDVIRKPVSARDLPPWQVFDKAKAVSESPHSLSSYGRLLVLHQNHLKGREAHSEVVHLRNRDAADPRLTRKGTTRSRMHSSVM